MRLLACLIVAPQRATMSQQSSLTQSAHSVRQVLTAYSEYGRSWVVPLVRTRRGESSADAAAISIRSPIRLLRCIPRILSRTFGLTSTNRCCQTRLVDLIRDAVSRGAEDVLFVGERSIGDDHFVGLPGLHAWVSAS